MLFVYLFLPHPFWYCLSVLAWSHLPICKISEQLTLFLLWRLQFGVLSWGFKDFIGACCFSKLSTPCDSSNIFQLLIPEEEMWTNSWCFTQRKSILFAQHCFKFILHIVQSLTHESVQTANCIIGKLTLCNLEQILNVSRSHNTWDFFLPRHILRMKVLSRFLVFFFPYLQTAFAVSSLQFIWTDSH